MFHTYVTASSGRKIDIDRARFLMDDELFAEAHRELIKSMTPQGFNPFDIARHAQAQAWHAEERQRPQSQKPQTGDCHWPVRVSTEGQEGTGTQAIEEPRLIRLGSHGTDQFVRPRQAKKP